MTQVSTNWWDGGEKVKIGAPFSPRKIENPLDRISRRLGGRRSRTHTERKRGRYIQARPANGRTDDLAFDATLRAAAPYQKSATELRKRVAFAIRSSDFQRKIRVKKASNLILFVVDASWSMAVAERMAGHQRRHPFLAHRCLPTPRPGWAGCLPKKPRHPDPASNQFDPACPASPGRYPGRR